MRRLSLIFVLIAACKPTVGAPATGTAAQMDIGAACTTDTDCDSGNSEVCQGGVCLGTEGSTCPDALATCDASACVPGYVCGRDGVGSPVCQPAGDCYPCTTDADCAPWGHCSAGVCQDGAPDAGG